MNYRLYTLSARILHPERELTDLFLTDMDNIIYDSELALHLTNSDKAFVDVRYEQKLKEKVFHKEIPVGSRVKIVSLVKERNLPCIHGYEEQYSPPEVLEVRLIDYDKVREVMRPYRQSLELIGAEIKKLGIFKDQDIDKKRRELKDYEVQRKEQYQSDVEDFFKKNRLFLADILRDL
ncbi:hypothetical protein KY321_05380 [Candidatus Woesearchaeota archaeon]|nr:hypothetical protein [Candidatus Woesearchaeota archaeon]